jgi:hypothetical protein
MTSYSADENLNLRLDPITAEELSVWANAYDRQYFGSLAPKIEIEIVEDAGGPACFVPLLNRIRIEKATTISEKFTRIALLHEMIHVRLAAENGDPDEHHGIRFQKEIERLYQAGAYRKLL